jgi:hypothetical protein
LTRPAAASKRRICSQPQGPQPALGEAVGAPGLVASPGRLAAGEAAGDAAGAPAHLGAGPAQPVSDATRPSAVATSTLVMDVRRLVTGASLVGGVSGQGGPVVWSASRMRFVTLRIR